MQYLSTNLCSSLVAFLSGIILFGCSSLSLSELQTPRTVGQGTLTPRAGIDYGPSLALLYDMPEVDIHRVARAAILPPVRGGLTYGLTDHLDVGVNAWSAGYWSALFLLASWDIGGQIHCKYMLTSPESRHSLAVGASGFGYAGKFSWGQENPFEVEVKGNAVGFNPLLLYGFATSDDPANATEIYTGLRAFVIDYHVEGEVEHFRTAPPPTYQTHNGTARFLSPILGVRFPSSSFNLFIEGGAFFGKDFANNVNPITSFTISLGITKRSKEENAEE